MRCKHGRPSILSKRPKKNCIMPALQVLCSLVSRIMKSYKKYVSENHYSIAIGSHQIKDIVQV